MKANMNIGSPTKNIPLITHCKLAGICFTDQRPKSERTT